MVNKTGGLLRFFAYSTGAVALWLVSVIVFVLPSQDPANLPLWIAITAGFFTFSLISLWHLSRHNKPWLRFAVVALAIPAVGFGVFQVVSMIAPSGGHFEGYLLLMGLILTGHGLAALAHTFMDRSVPGPRS